MGPAVLIGQFIGAILVELAPVIIALWKEMQNATAEKGAPQAALRDRLRERIARLRAAREAGSEDDLRAGGDPGAAP